MYFTVNRKCELTPSSTSSFGIGGNCRQSIAHRRCWSIKMLYSINPMEDASQTNHPTSRCGGRSDYPRTPQDTPGHPQDTQGYPRTHLISYIIHLFIHLFIHSDENKAKMASNSFHFQVHSFEKALLNTAEKP